MTKNNLKQQVRDFYDQVGWHELSEGLYQNARYEDLRPVSRAYIHLCHLRVSHHLASGGHYLLDAGSGPIQYPEYLEYSKGYRYRVCADISIQALVEARKRIESHGLFVVSDIANLPFAPDVFDGIVSLHTVHHLSIDEHPRAYNEMFRVLKPSRSAVIVNGWHQPGLENVLRRLRKFTLRVQGFINYRILKRPTRPEVINPLGSIQGNESPKSTFVQKNHPSWFKKEIGSLFPTEILVWRSVSVKDLRTFVHDGWGGRRILRILFWLEERFPHWFGENGQYPLIVIRKSERAKLWDERMEAS